jgi:hypothetical protein
MAGRPSSLGDDGWDQSLGGIVTLPFSIYCTPIIRVLFTLESVRNGT